MKDAGKVTTWLLAFVVAAALGFGLLIGVGCAIGANACPFGESGTVTSTDGRTIFLQLCAACHGRDATGGTGPSLVSGLSADLSYDELQEKIARGRPFQGMPRFKDDLSEKQIEAVAKYVLTLREETP